MSYVPLFKPDEYLRPETVEETVSLLKKYGDKAMIIGGGMHIVELAEKNILPRVDKLVDVGKLGLKYIKTEGATVKVGASVTLSELEASHFVREPPYRVVREALDSIAIVQVKNVATVGGCICCALPIYDMPPALIVLGTTLRAFGPSGEREIPLEELYIDYFLTTLKSNEFVLEVKIPKLTANTGSAFYKMGDSKVDIATVNAAARVTLDAQGICQTARIALGSVARTTLRIKNAEKILEGKKLADELVDEAAQTVYEQVKPFSDFRASSYYRKEMCKVITKRVLTVAFQAAKKGG